MLPDLYAKGIGAAVDFLGTCSLVDRERIGATGICGSGSFVVSAAELDPCMKAVATASMDDMGTFLRQGLRQSQTPRQRQEVLESAARQRYDQFDGGDVERGCGTPLELTPDSTDVEREFLDFHRTPRGESTPAGASPDRTTMRRITGEVKFTNFHPFDDLCDRVDLIPFDLLGDLFDQHLNA